MTFETLRRYFKLPMFDFESKSAKKRLLDFKSAKNFFQQKWTNYVDGIVFDLIN